MPGYAGTQLAPRKMGLPSLERPPCCLPCFVELCSSQPGQEKGLRWAVLLFCRGHVAQLQGEGNPTLVCFSFLLYKQDDSGREGWVFEFRGARACWQGSVAWKPWALGSAWETAQDLEVKKGGECSPAGDGQQRAEVENGEERPKDS